MILKEWEVWYTYATYFINPIENLDVAAKNLVYSGLLDCAFISDGRFHCLENSVLISGNVDLTLDSNRESLTFKIKPSVPHDNYSREALFQSIYFRFAELKQYSESGYFLPKYLRGHLGECQLIYNNHAYLVYPIIKLFETGVLLVELRVSSPEENIEVGEFVEKFINLYKRNFNDVLVPPALRLAGQHAYALSETQVNPIILRIGSFILDRDLRNYLAKSKQKRRSGDFEFESVHLWGEYNDKSKSLIAEKPDPAIQIFSLHDLASTIFGAVSVSVNGLRKGKSLLIKPNTILVLGDSWLGRPHVHLVRFQGQTATAKKNEEKFINDFGWILSGSETKASDAGKKYVPPNARNFDDYGAYITQEGTLWVWSKQGLLMQEKWDVPNRGNFVYFNQSQCELLEYGNMLHRQLFQLVSNPQSVDAALKARNNMVNLDAQMSHISGYGEINDLLSRGWKDMQVDKLQKVIADMIEIRQAEASLRDGRNLATWQTIISIIFGIVAVPGFASEFVKPVWGLLNLWKPTDPNAEQVWFFGIALLLVGIPIVTLMKWARKNQ